MGDVLDLRQPRAPPASEVRRAVDRLVLVLEVRPRLARRRRHRVERDLVRRRRRRGLAVQQRARRIDLCARRASRPLGLLRSERNAVRRLEVEQEFVRVRARAQVRAHRRPLKLPPLQRRPCSNPRVVQRPMEAARRRLGARQRRHELGPERRPAVRHHAGEQHAALARRRHHREGRRRDRDVAAIDADVGRECRQRPVGRRHEGARPSEGRPHHPFVVALHHVSLSVDDDQSDERLGLADPGVGVRDVDHLYRRAGVVQPSRRRVEADQTHRRELEPAARVDSAQRVLEGEVGDDAPDELEVRLRRASLGLDLDLLGLLRARELLRRLEHRRVRGAVEVDLTPPREGRAPELHVVRPLGVAHVAHHLLGDAEVAVDDAPRERHVHRHIGATLVDLIHRARVRLVAQERHHDLVEPRLVEVPS